MTDDILILKTIINFGVSYSSAKFIIMDLKNRGELEEYSKCVDKIKSYQDFIDYYFDKRKND